MTVNVPPADADVHASGQVALPDAHVADSARGLRRAKSKLRAVHQQSRTLIPALSLASDMQSVRAFRTALRGRGEQLGEPVTMRVRPLGGATVQLRPGTSDAQMLLETFRDRVHEPPREALRRGIRHIVDLGANLGITAAHNARMFPDARIVAVELDPENAALCRRHVEPWSDRVTVLQAAVWTDDGEVRYVHELGNEYGFYVGDNSSGTHTAQALSINSIFAHLPAETRVDWLKMDIEGVEAKLLSGAAAAWTERVDAIGLQVHDPYSLDDCAHDLEQLGFAPRVDERRGHFIVGVRP